MLGILKFYSIQRFSIFSSLIFFIQANSPRITNNPTQSLTISHNLTQSHTISLIYPITTPTFTKGIIFTYIPVYHNTYRPNITITKHFPSLPT